MIAIAAQAMVDFKRVLAERNDPAIKALYTETTEKGLDIIGSTAVVTIHGALVPDADPWEERYFGLANTTRIARMLANVLADDRIKTVVMDINSPGGYSEGIAEIASMLYAARNSKRIVADTHGILASAAYWIASQAHEIGATRGTLVGSVGTYVAYLDSSKRFKEEGLEAVVVVSDDIKATGYPGTEITDKQKASVQALVDDLTDMFTGDIARTRSTPKASLTGAVHLASRALELGLIDHITTEGISIMDKAQLEALAAMKAELAEMKTNQEAEQANHAEALQAMQEAHATMQGNYKASQDQLADAQAKLLVSEGEALIASYRLTEGVLTDAAGKPNRIHALAYSDPETFKQIAERLQVSVPNTEPVGETDAGEMDPAQQIVALAGALKAKSPGMTMNTALVAAQRQIGDKK